ncbi:MAG TPA: 3-keto-5-aminohexanoate cleavage protein [Maritimibacter sp.]|nr:3-keto-5-aminohexanoate cleavage protein [Maritimibacter sp.]
MSKKVIITCAVTGSIHTPSMSPHLPVTPEEITAAAVGAAEAGAAVIHLHARDPETGAPEQTIERYMEFLPRIKQQTGAILNITTGGGLGMSMDTRLAPALAAKPELASMNMGSMNFNISGAAKSLGPNAQAWERPYVEGGVDIIMSNTFAQIERAMRALGDNGTRFEFECYDVGHLYTLAHFVDKGLVKPPFFIQLIFGIAGGIGAHPENLTHMKSICDRLFGNDYRFSVLGAGRHQFPLVTMSAIMGGNVRVGLEDNLYLGKGELAPSNAAQVEKIRRILTELGLKIATPDEARDLLATKGAAEVAF